MQLTEEEREVLTDILRRALGEVREEVYRSDVAAFKEGMRHREQVVRSLLAKCEGAAAQPA